jgi:hypothetical protein
MNGKIYQAKLIPRLKFSFPFSPSEFSAIIRSNREGATIAGCRIHTGIPKSPVLSQSPNVATDEGDGVSNVTSEGNYNRIWDANAKQEKR